MQTADDTIDRVSDTASAALGTLYLGNPVRAWLVALGIFLGTLAVLVGARWLVTRRLEAVAARTHTRVDDYIISLLRRTRYFFILTVAAAAAIQALTVPEKLGSLLEQLVRLVVLLQLGLWANEFISLYLHRLTRRRAATDLASVTTMNALAMVVRLTLWVVVLLVALATFGVDVTALITGLGIAGVAVALAVQNVLGDLLASLSIVLDKPFVVGDTIAVDTFTGTVEEVGIKTTRLRSISGEQLVFSNADLLKARIRNYKRMQERRVVFTFGLDYATPPDLVERIPGIVRELVEAEPQTRFDRAHFQRFGASSLDFEVVYFMTVSDYNAYMDTQQRINLMLMRRLAELGVEFAFPTQTLYVREEAQGASSRTQD
ncbi:MAG TPA: mechanosensitive ion channel family protein [Gemmatimonadales bacterium]